MPLSEVGWNGHDNIVAKLWRFNQHYFDDLNAIKSSERKMWHDQLLERWINENNLKKGWHGTPIQRH